jgi:hypothetical protein
MKLTPVYQILSDMEDDLIRERYYIRKKYPWYRWFRRWEKIRESDIRLAENIRIRDELRKKGIV